MNLAVLGEQALDRLGDHESLLFEGVWHRSGTLAARARRVAGALAGLGVRPGDRVVLVMANCPEVGLAYAALWRAGAVPTPVLFLLTEDELRHVVKDSGATALVTTPEFLDKVRAAAGPVPIVLVGGGQAGTTAQPGTTAQAGMTAQPGTIAWAELEAGPEAALVARAGDDLAALLYTGGTTGRSKGVALTHDSLAAAGQAASALAYEPGRSCTLLPLPLAHVYGLMLSVAGLFSPEPASAVLMRWFDAAGFVDLVERNRVTATALVPSMIQMLLAQPLEDRDLSSLRRVGSGGAPLAPEVLREFERRLPGAMVREGYGCTESSALISTQPRDERRIGSVGRPIPGLQVQILGPEGEACDADKDGEICVRGPVLMKGYWQSPEATDEAVRDGWLHTGDIGHLDPDGWLWVVDRLKDLIIRNGFNVYPRDVEDVLLAHPDVAAAAVVGRPDPRVGEEVVAFVQLADGASATPEDLVAHARQHISAAKYPREVHLVDEIPLTSVLKTDRKALRRLVRP